MLQNYNTELFNALTPWQPRNLRFALIRFGGGIVGMSGSIAGNTFARNRYGNYARARTKPINPNSAGQQGIRNALTEIVERWNEELDAAQRAAWKQYADNIAMQNKLGETIHLSGFNHYVRSNVFRVYAGVAPIDDGPTDFSLPATDGTASNAIDSATQEHTFTFDNQMAWANELKGFLVFEMGRPQNPTRDFFAGPWSWNFKLTGDPGDLPATPKTQGVAKAVAAGQKVWWYARIARADGRLSTTFRGISIVT